ncbi:hypothetical protein K8Z61_18530 [Nocardioides sp. TRM66260-LWL]|uniref:hypothetical protein n=1 Tax=Nocardioides sp. TRM66260-LWL TaxID=2874478 RepID=UPI001CC37AA0|nr:hypothetical protein [Nocardioides sp. TRM66260-LWL]MBZ5736492.1 hypothetical protein [Nocardioides sp. TRM66260-LWL]
MTGRRNGLFLTADDVCAAVEAAMVRHVPRVIGAAALDEYDPPATWRQTPTIEALREARREFPAGAIVSTGPVGDPKQQPTGYDATFRVEVGVFDRGTDWNDTATRIRTWAGIIRAAAHVDRTLGGIAAGVTWVGETYRRFPDPQVARTLGGCAVELDVYVEDVLTLAQLPDPDTGEYPPGHVVTRTTHTVTSRPLT